MTMHDIVSSINIAGGDVVVQGVLRLARSTRRSDERPPVMYGHFCLVQNVSVHDRYYFIGNGKAFNSFTFVTTCDTQA